MIPTLSTSQKRYNRSLLFTQGKCWVSASHGESVPDGLGIERKRSSRTIILVAILVAVLVLGAVAWFAVQIVDNDKTQPTKYTRHSPISINGNGEFTNFSGVIRGIGTASDPYIIVNWDIDATTAHGIRIMNTDAHFIVRNCYVHDGSPSNDGIDLSNSVNGTIENNNFVRDSAGIGLVLSGNNTLANNTCSSNNYVGIGLALSGTNTLTNNTCSSNGHDGIFLLSSNNNEISWNQVSNNGGCGVNISSGSNNRIWYNTIIGNNGATSTYNASHTQARDDGANNWWNGTDGLDNRGNYWSDWTTPDAVPPQGIVDHPYIILGSAGAKDYYPLSYNPRIVGISFISSWLP